MTRGVRWPTEEEARVHVGPVTACARDEARLGWSSGGGGAARSDRSGGEDEPMEKKAWRLLDPVGEEGGEDRSEAWRRWRGWAWIDRAAETERKRTREGRRAWFIKEDL